MKYLLLLALVLPKICCCQKSNIEVIGDVTQLLLPATAGVSTIILKDKKGTWQFVKSYATTAVITFGLKHTVKKKRPESHNTHSFPSGHTSSAFSGASFIQRRYGWKYGAPAYALAAFTGYSRVYAKKHYPVDVIAGVLVGIGSTYIFTTPYQQEHMELTFTSTPDNSYLIGFKYKF